MVIGKDTRLSGYLIEPALTAGFVSVGMDVILAGPVPTPAVAILTRSLRADLGVMISASHNPFADNGIKLFAGDGYKLSDAVEAEIEAHIDNGRSDGLAPPGGLGRAQRLEDAQGRYIEFVKSTFPKHRTLEGLKVVVDCANGASYRVAPSVLWELGAEVVPIAADPDGFNINRRCGSTHPEPMQAQVVASKADLGIALDGDGDRLVIADEHGALLDGDQLMGLIAAFWQRSERLKGGGIVATVMSNFGLERYLEGLGLTLHRTRVGDRYVVDAMRKHALNLGGEQSGHIILGDFATTGDGLIAALQFLAVIVDAGRPGERGRARLRAVAAKAAQRGAERRRAAAARGRRGVRGHSRGRGPPVGPRTIGDPRIGDRAGDPGHGRGRGSGARRRGGGRHHARARAGIRLIAEPRYSALLKESRGSLALQRDFQGRLGKARR